jgi:hypothetical protein
LIAVRKNLERRALKLMGSYDCSSGQLDFLLVILSLVLPQHKSIIAAVVSSAAVTVLSCALTVWAIGIAIYRRQLIESEVRTVRLSQSNNAKKKRLYRKNGLASGTLSLGVALHLIGTLLAHRQAVTSARSQSAGLGLADAGSAYRNPSSLGPPAKNKALTFRISPHGSALRYSL